MPLTGGRGGRKFILINGPDQAVETTHYIVDARYDYSISRELQEHFKWPLC